MKNRSYCCKYRHTSKLFNSTIYLKSNNEIIILKGFNCGPGGCAGSAGMSGSQTYDLPGGRHINLGYGGTFSNAGGQPAYGQSNTINFT